RPTRRRPTTNHSVYVPVTHPGAPSRAHHADRPRGDVAFDVTNTGDRAGAEVAQVYVGPGPNVSGVQQAVRSLQGFSRTELAAGQTKRITVHLPERAFQYWDETSQSWKTNWGQRTLWVGDADAPDNLPLSGQLLGVA